MPPDAEFSPRRVLTANEIMRIGVALHVYGAQRTGRSYVVMAKDRPNDVLGVTSDKSEAETLIRRASKPDAFDVYGPFDPPAYPFANEVRVSAHDGTTQCTLCEILETVGDKGSPRPEDIVTITTTIHWKKGGRRNPDDVEAPNAITYEIPYKADSIFLTRSGREGFVYPRYHTLFGAEYVKTLRAKLRDPA